MIRNVAVAAEQIAADAIARFEEWDACGRPTQPKPALHLTPQQTAALIDHTLLKPDSGKAALQKLCDEANEYGFASVCVHPSWVPECAQFLADSLVRICAVAGFPHGTNSTAAKRFEAGQAIADGAIEIDMVIHVGKLKDGNYAYVMQDIAAVADVCHARGAVLKTIIETCLLTDAEKAAACALAVEAGADYVKTSTGFNGHGATVEDVALMRFVVGPETCIKAAGGIHTYDELAAMVEAGANRIGASAGVQIVRGARS